MNMAFLSTEPFIIALPSSRDNLNNVQGCHGQGKSLENEIFSRSGKS